MSAADHPRVLRAGLVYDGLIVDECIVRAGGSLTLGTDARCTFRMKVPGMPGAFALFDHDGARYRLRWTDGMSGQLRAPARGSELPVGDLASLVPLATLEGDSTHALPLAEQHKGKIRVGDAFVLFHFVADAAPPARRGDEGGRKTPVVPGRWTSSVQFHSEAHRAVYERVRGFLEQHWGRFGSHPTQPYFALDKGSARAVVRIDPWQQQDAIVRVVSWVITGAHTEDPTLLRFLLESNHGTLFGAFGIDPEGDIFFAHSIVGSTCDQEELVASVESVLQTADEFDDVIQRRWGGMRALDAVVADEPTVDDQTGIVHKFTRIQLSADGSGSCIRGLPVRVRDVLDLMRAGRTDREICQVFPGIEPDDLAQVREYGDYLEASADRLLDG